MNSESYRNTKNQNTERQKPSFTYEWVQNADLHKLAPNKKMTTLE